MKVFVASHMIGAFAFDEKKRIVHYSLFRPDPELIAGRIAKVRLGELIPEEVSLLKDLVSSGYKEIIWDKKIDYPGIKCMYEPENTGKTVLQRDFRKLALGLKWVDSEAELNRILSRVSILLTKNEMRKPKRDRYLMHAVSVMDELDRVINTLSERMREWYGLYFPEAERLIQSHDHLARVIAEQGSRDKITDKRVARYAKVSAGMPFSEADLSAVREYAASVLSLYKTRESVAGYIKQSSKDVIPNLSAVAGPLIASRLLAQAGGLERIAKMSASTLQLLGAEKALFRHLRGQGRAPKFGVIFAHPLVQKAGKSEKGKVARILASKLTMAARADFYTGKDISEKLLQDLRSKLKQKAKRTAKGKKK